VKYTIAGQIRYGPLPSDCYRVLTVTVKRRGVWVLQRFQQSGRDLVLVDWPDRRQKMCVAYQPHAKEW